VDEHSKQRDIEKFYTIGQKLGTGSFAVVKEAWKKADNSPCAVKIIKTSNLKKEELEVVYDEVDILGKIQHPNIVQLYDVFEAPKKLYLVMELLRGGELFDAIVNRGSYSEQDAASVIKSVASAIDHLHSIGVVHRDLKPENLLYADAAHTQIKLTDFGLAKLRGKSAPGSQWTMNTACGTPGYVAPEVLKREAYSQAVDLWSLGVILYILLCGFPPFYHEQTAQLYKQIKKGEFAFTSPYWDDISETARDLVCKLLVVDPAQRYTAKQVLAHPFVTGEASTKAFSASHTRRLQLLQARRRLRRGIQTIVAVNRFADQLRRLAQQ